MKAHLNPFAPDRVQRQLPFDPELSGSNWAEIEDRWIRCGRHAAVVGHKGSGKSTFLKSFARRLESKHPVVTLSLRREDFFLTPPQRELLQTLNQETILLVDGEGHLNPYCRFRLRSLARTARGYLVTRHHHCRLPLLLKLQSDRELAERLVARLDLEDLAMVRSQIPALLEKKKGNLREVWLSLYDDYASQP